ncbi:MAG: TetR/AcrR family transcriptional regulator [Acidimicrobiales bacterium]|jgi:AcrR family transcriptional regulator
MARSGIPSRPRTSSSARSNTRQDLIEAAVEVLKSRGFSGASARAIATEAGVNQALVFYHFGTVAELLLAALDEVSARRLTRYRTELAEVTDPGSLIALATKVFREDIDSGDIAVLAEMIAGSSSVPELGAEVAKRIAPWKEFASVAIESGFAASGLASLLPIGTVSHAAVALYLGLEMLSHLEGDRTAATSLFEQLARLAAVLDVLNVPAKSTDKGGTQ